MRLNRVLLLAATINILIFALLFTISCSGEDGKPGKAGDNCTVDPNGDDTYTVLCNNIEVGTLRNNDTGEPGDQGEDGANGAPGAPGANGTYCFLSGLSIVCDGQKKGDLSSCDISFDPSNKQHIIAVCGTSNKIDICDGLELTDKTAGTYGTKIFDPAKNTCSDSGAVVSLNEYKGQCPSFTDANGKVIAGAEIADRRTQYCGPKADTSGHIDTSAQYVAQNICGLNVGQKLYPNTRVEASKSTKSSCDSAGYYWDGASATTGICRAAVDSAQYCRYGISNKETSGLDLKLDTIAFLSTERCNDGKRPNSNGKFAGEYCGYNTNADKEKSNRTIVRNNVCPDYYTHQYDGSKDTLVAGKAGARINNYGPDQKGYNSVFCGVAFADREPIARNPEVWKVTTLDTFCVTLDSIPSKNIRQPLNKGTKWNREYCGYGVKGTDTIITVQKDMCDKADGSNTIGPHQLGYKQGYCQADKDGITTYSEEKCGGKQTINEKVWNSQYCGKNNKDVDTRYADLCDIGGGPNQTVFGGGYCRVGKDGISEYSEGFCDDKTAPNDGAWKNEYCGIPFDTTGEAVSTAMAGACDSVKGPNSESFGGGYCSVNRLGVISYSDVFCGDSAKLNEIVWEENKWKVAEWKGEYCGVDSASTPTVYTGVCDDDKGPNSEKFGGGYCKWLEGATGTVLSSEYCGAAKYNEGAWKAEYCFKGDTTVATCTGGRRANEEMSSTDPFSVRCEFRADNLLCTDETLTACDKDGCDKLGAAFVWDADISVCKQAGKKASKRHARR